MEEKTPLPCAECGHLHFFGAKIGYAQCPIEECSCEGQLWAVADARAALTGITHYVLHSGRETWVCGRGARNALWPGAMVLYESLAEGKG